MAGLLTLLFGTAVAVSGIKHAADNAWCKQNLRKTLPNGIPYYTDADGKDRLMDGTQILWLDYCNPKIIKIPSHEVIYDKKGDIEREARLFVDALNEKLKNTPLVIKLDETVYTTNNKSYCYRPYERSTGKRIYKVWCVNKTDGTTGENIQEFRKCYSCYYHDRQGEVISKEEYKSIYNTYQFILKEIKDSDYKIKDCNFWNW